MVAEDNHRRGGKLIDDLFRTIELVSARAHRQISGDHRGVDSGIMQILGQAVECDIIVSADMDVGHMSDRYRRAVARHQRSRHLPPMATFGLGPMSMSLAPRIGATAAGDDAAIREVVLSS